MAVRVRQCILRATQSESSAWVAEGAQLLGHKSTTYGTIEFFVTRFGAVRCRKNLALTCGIGESGRRESNPRSQLGKPIEGFSVTCG